MNIEELNILGSISGIAGHAITITTAIQFTQMLKKFSKLSESMSISFKDIEKSFNDIGSSIVASTIIGIKQWRTYPIT